MGVGEWVWVGVGVLGLLQVAVGVADPLRVGLGFSVAVSVCDGAAPPSAMDGCIGAHPNRLANGGYRAGALIALALPVPHCTEMMLQLLEAYVI